MVTGGAGFVGSHVVRQLRADGVDVIVLDDLSTGRREALPPQVPLVEGDVGDRGLVHALCRDGRLDAVIHCAGLERDTAASPLRTFDVNASRTRALLESALQAGVRRFVWSSSAAVYGRPVVVPVPERAGCVPEDAYGRSKLMAEWMLTQVATVTPSLRYVTLRAYTVLGGVAGMRCGPGPLPSLVRHLMEVAQGRRRHLDLYGQDYPTPDGTCVRDYLHVADFATAHGLALRHLLEGGDSRLYNVGTGRGATVLETVAAMEQAGGMEIPVSVDARRPDERPVLVVDPTRIMSELDWSPQTEDLVSLLRGTLALAQ